MGSDETRDRREFRFRSRYFRFRPCCNPLVFQGVYPRVQLPPIDQRVIESLEPSQSVWAVKPLPVGLFPLLVDPRWRQGPGDDIEVSELENPWDPLSERGFYGITENQLISRCGEKDASLRLLFTACKSTNFTLFTALEVLILRLYATYHVY